MTPLEWFMAAAGLVSALGSGSALFLVQGKLRIDSGELREMEQRRDDKDRERNRERIDEDLKRADALRKELAVLTKISNDRFEHIVESEALIMQLRSEVLGLRQWAAEHVVWDNMAVRRLQENDIEMGPPPTLPMVPPEAP